MDWNWSTSWRTSEKQLASLGEAAEETERTKAITLEDQPEKQPQISLTAARFVQAPWRQQRQQWQQQTLVTEARREQAPWRQ